MDHKYSAVPTTYNGIRFSSKGEAGRYADLLLFQRAGQIRGLETQVPYDLVVNGVLVCRYVADFRYTENGRTVVEDWKGMRTPMYRLKKKLMKAVHGIDIFETGTPPKKRRKRRRIQ